MRHARLAIATLILTVTVAHRLAAADQPKPYFVMIDLSKEPFPAIKRVSLDESKIVALCRTDAGCKMQLKMSGTSGPYGAVEMVVLSKTDLGYTSTTTWYPPPPPKVDGDGVNRFLAVVREQVSPSNNLATCYVSDQENEGNFRDVREGFMLEMDITGPAVGLTACGLEITARSPSTP